MVENARHLQSKWNTVEPLRTRDSVSTMNHPCSFSLPSLPTLIAYYYCLHFSFGLQFYRENVRTLKCTNLSWTTEQCRTPGSPTLQFSVGNSHFPREALSCSFTADPYPPRGGCCSVILSTIVSVTYGNTVCISFCVRLLWSHMLCAPPTVGRCSPPGLHRSDSHPSLRDGVRADSSRWGQGPPGG